MCKTRVRVPMPPSQRAKIFSMLDVLKGLWEALAAQEQKPEPRRCLSENTVEELSQVLLTLQKQQVVTVVYYCEYQHQTCQLTGAVAKVDPYWKTLQLGDICIAFEELYSISLQ